VHLLSHLWKGLTRTVPGFCVFVRIGLHSHSDLFILSSAKMGVCGMRLEEELRVGIVPASVSPG
jgi:hypothetical protein